MTLTNIYLYLQAVFVVPALATVAACWIGRRIW